MIIDVSKQWSTTINNPYFDGLYSTARLWQNRGWFIIALLTLIKPQMADDCLFGAVWNTRGRENPRCLSEF